MSRKVDAISRTTERCAPENGLQAGVVRLWRPTSDDPGAQAGMAHCLSAAFSSGIWRQTPMPLGEKRDPASAYGVIGGLGPHPLTLAASSAPGGDIVGCVVGCVMDGVVVANYGLEKYGAEPGDGLFAFIGIVPEAQGLRFADCGEGVLRASPDAPSLARHLFQTWIDFEALAPCPRIFIRTRQRIGPIRYLSEATGFEFLGGFETDFRGQRQTRLVYRRGAPGKVPG